MYKYLLALCALCLSLPLVVSGAPLPPDSVYRLPPLMLVDQQGQSFALDSLAGQPRLIGMFYGSCHMVCPLEIDTVKKIQQQIVRAGGKPIPVLLVSFDSRHDQLSDLRQLAREHHITAPLFQLTRVTQGDVGLLGGVLGISWRALPDGGFVHNAVLTLLDDQGRILARQDAQNPPQAEFIQAILAQQNSAR